jgi:hypothetical protein
MSPLSGERLRAKTIGACPALAQAGRLRTISPVPGQNVCGVPSPEVDSWRIVALLLAACAMQPVQSRSGAAHIMQPRRLFVNPHLGIGGMDQATDVQPSLCAASRLCLAGHSIGIHDGPQPENDAPQGHQIVTQARYPIGPHRPEIRLCRDENQQEDKVEIPDDNRRRKNGRAFVPLTGVDLPQSGDQ